MLHNVSFAIYRAGRLIRSTLVGSISYDDCEALEANLQRDYPGCDVAIGEY